jgi:hypothetical protein
MGLRGILLQHSSTMGGKPFTHHSKVSRKSVQGPQATSAFDRNASLVETMADEVDAALKEVDGAAGAGGPSALDRAQVQSHSCWRAW